MKAAVFHGPRDVRFENIDAPSPGEGEALMRIKACGICGSDLHTYRHGMFLQLGTEIGDGRVLGHEFSGEIVEVNGDASGLEVGQRVCTVGMGGNAEYLRLTRGMAALARPFSPDISFEEAATTEPLATSLHAVNIAEPKDGETHVIFGAGIIGLGVLQCIKAVSNANTVVVDLSERRLEMAKSMGADETINAGQSDAVDTILTQGGARELSLVEASEGVVDTVYDCAGAGKNSSGKSVLSQAMDIVSVGGKVVVVAVFERPVEIDCNIMVRKGILLHGSWGWLPHEFKQAAELIDAGKVDRKPLISHTFSLEDASEAYETQLQAEEAIKVILTP